jgi:hypothetical protein
MPAWSFALRLLLCLMLALNGAMPAHANANATATAAPRAHEAPEAMPCHAEAVPSVHADAGVASVSRAGGSNHADTDCCGADACRCACVQLAQAVLPAITTTAPGPLRAVLRGESGSSRGSPNWPVQIRPPIG